MRENVGISELIGRPVDDLSKARLTKIRARGPVTLNATKDLIVIMFDDENSLGAATYEVLLTFDGPSIAAAKEADPKPAPPKSAFEPRTTWFGHVDGNIPTRIEVGDIAADKFTGTLLHPAVAGGAEPKASIRGTIAGNSVSFAYQAEDVEKDGILQPRRYSGTVKGNAIEGSFEEVAGGKKGTFNLHRVAADTDWAQLDTTDKPTIKDGYLHSNRQDDPRSPAYSTGTHLIKGPVEITAVFRTEGNNVRFHAFKGSAVVLNWESKKDQLRVNRPDGTDGKLESGSMASLRVSPLSVNTWYKLRWRITEKGMEVLIDDQLVFREKKRYDLSKPTPIRISNGDGLDIKSFRFMPLDAKKATVDLPATPATSNGILMKGPLDRATMPVPSTQVGKTFNISKSWILSVDFLVTDRSNDPRFIFFWGDERPGRDPIVLCLTGDELQASVANTVDDTGHGLVSPFPKSMIGKWVSVLYSYDAPTKELELYLDGTLVAKDRCAITPRVDRPMPVFVGGGAQNDARFQGKVRSLSLSNR